MAEPITIVFPLYPGVTHLDFTGPHQFLARLPGAHADHRLGRRRARLRRRPCLCRPCAAGNDRALRRAVRAGRLRLHRRDAGRGLHGGDPPAGRRRPLYHLGLHRLADPGRRGAAARQTRHLPLGVARPAGAVRRHPGPGPRRARRQRADRRRRDRGDRLRADPGDRAGRPAGGAGDPARRWNTPPPRPSTPAGRRRRRPRCWRWCASGWRPRWRRAARRWSGRRRNSVRWCGRRAGAAPAVRTRRAAGPDVSPCRGRLAKGVVVPQWHVGDFRAAAETGCLRRAANCHGAIGGRPHTQPAPATVRAWASALRHQFCGDFATRLRYSTEVAGGRGTSAI